MFYHKTIRFMNDSFYLETIGHKFDYKKEIGVNNILSQGLDEK